MKYFKKFFTMVGSFGKKIYNSKGFEIAAFVYDSVNVTVDWSKKTAEFDYEIEQEDGDEDE